MKRDPFRSLLATAVLAMAFFLPTVAWAAPLVSFDTPVVTGSTQAPGVWYTDRYAPNIFTSPVTAPDGRTGTLLEGIRPSDSLANRPSAFQTNFYNTQGRKYDLPAGTTSAFIDLYVPSAWSGLNQNVPGAEGRVAGFWATGFDSSDNVSSFPIIEFDNLAGGSFRTWDIDNGVFDSVGGFTGYDQWYQIGFTIDPATGGVTYFVNGSPVNSYSSVNGTESLGNVILQGYNAGNSFDIYWDSLTTSPVPEPGTLIAFGFALAGGAGYWARRRTANP